MPTDFHKDLVVLVWSLVPRYNDLSTRKVLQLVYLEKKTSEIIIWLWISPPASITKHTDADGVSNYGKLKHSLMKGAI